MSLSFLSTSLFVITLFSFISLYSLVGLLFSGEVIKRSLLSSLISLFDNKLLSSIPLSSLFTFLISELNSSSFLLPFSLLLTWLLSCNLFSSILFILSGLEIFLVLFSSLNSLPCIRISSLKSKGSPSLIIWDCAAVSVSISFCFFLKGFLPSMKESFSDILSLLEGRALSVFVSSRIFILVLFLGSSLSIIFCSFNSLVISYSVSLLKISLFLGSLNKILFSFKLLSSLSNKSVSLFFICSLDSICCEIISSFFGNWLNSSLVLIILSEFSSSLTDISFWGTWLFKLDTIGSSWLFITSLSIYFVSWLFRCSRISCSLSGFTNSGSLFITFWSSLIFIIWGEIKLSLTFVLSISFWIWSLLLFTCSVGGIQKSFSSWLWIGLFISL